MAFTADTYKRMECQLSGMDRMIERTNQLLKPREKMLKSLDIGLYQSMGRTAFQAANQASPALQIAERVKNSVATGGFAQLNNLRADAARAFGVKPGQLAASGATKYIGAFEGLPKHMAGLNSGLVSGLVSDMAAARLRPLHAFSASAVTAGVHRGITNNAWRALPVRSKYDDILRGYEIVTKLPSWSSAVSLLRDKQTMHDRMLGTWRQPGSGTALTAAIGSGTALTRIAKALLDEDLTKVRTVAFTAEALDAAPPAMILLPEAAAPVETYTSESVADAAKFQGVLEPANRWLTDLNEKPPTVQIFYATVGSLVLMVFYDVVKGITIPYIVCFFQH